MEIGAIGFHEEKLRKYEPNISKNRDILKALKKTEKEVKEPDFKAMKDQRLQELKKIY